jgi:Transport and Golgi organisation 2
VCTVVVGLEPGERVPLLLLGIRDEFTGRPWRPPARHWPPSPLIGGLDEQAGGTWLAVHPGIPRVSCILNGRGALAAPDGRRSRGELPLRAAAEGPGALERLASDPGALAHYDPFHLVCAGLRSVSVLSWDAERATSGELAAGTHVLTNAGHAYPAARFTVAGELAGVDNDVKAAYFGPRFAASRPGGDPGKPLADAWGDWLRLAEGGGLSRDAPRAIIVRRELPDGPVWGSTSVTLVALAETGLRYDFQPAPGETAGWYPVSAAADSAAADSAAADSAAAGWTASRDEG